MGNAWSPGKRRRLGLALLTTALLSVHFLLLLAPPYRRGYRKVEAAVALTIARGICGETFSPLARSIIPDQEVYEGDPHRMLALRAETLQLVATYMSHEQRPFVIRSVPFVRRYDLLAGVLEKAGRRYGELEDQIRQARLEEAAEEDELGRTLSGSGWKPCGTSLVRGREQRAESRWSGLFFQWLDHHPELCSQTQARRLSWASRVLRFAAWDAFSRKGEAGGF